MTFHLVEPDRLMWPGKYGLIAKTAKGDFILESDLPSLAARSTQLVFVPSGREGVPSTYIFCSSINLGRVEVVLQHGYIWPLNPPLGGRAIMDEIVDHLNQLAKNV